MQFSTLQGPAEQPEFVAVTGNPVEIVSYLTTYLYRKSPYCFFVIEEKSGLAIGRGITERQAVKNARRRVRPHKQAHVLMLINREIEKFKAAQFVKIDEKGESWNY